MSDQKISELTAITGANTADDDLLVIVDTSTGETKKITLGELEAGIARGDMTFGDNQKAIFGAGSDLQIYHDGSGSYINEVGTGNMFLQGTNFRLKSANGDETFLLANTNSGLSIYYDNAVKLATTSTGIDVTGTATMDGLTVDGDLAINSTNNVSITQTHTDGNTVTFTQSGTGGDVEWRNANGGALIRTNGLGRLNVQSDGDISFYEDTGTTASLTWDADATRLLLTGRETSRGGGTYALEVDNSTQSSNLSAAGAVRVKGFYGDSFIVNGLGDVSFFDDSGSAKFFWDASAESLGIGTGSPETTLDIVAANTLGSSMTGTTVGQGIRVTQTAASYLAGNYVSLVEGTFRDSGTGADVRIAAMYDAGGSNLSFGVTNSYGQINKEAMFIDSVGNVGIGTSSPSQKLHLSSTGNTYARIDGGASSTTGLLLDNGDGAIYYNGASDYMRLDTSGTERMRIDSSGDVLIGTTAAQAFGGLNPRLIVESSQDGIAVQNINSGYAAFHTKASAAHNYYAAIFQNSTPSSIGSIYCTTTSTAYNTSSDYRLKEDWQPMLNASTRVEALKPVNFAWKVDGSRVDGFLAHELAEVVPEAVTGEKDAVDAEGNPEYQGIDQSKIVPLLTAALQEALSRITTLEAEVAALKGN